MGKQGLSCPYDLDSEFLYQAFCLIRQGGIRDQDVNIRQFRNVGETALPELAGIAKDNFPLRRLHHLLGQFRLLPCRTGDSMNDIKAVNLEQNMFRTD